MARTRPPGNGPLGRILDAPTRELFRQVLARLDEQDAAQAAQTAQALVVDGAARTVNVGGNRLVSVADPAAGFDAVNRRTLEQYVLGQLAAPILPTGQVLYGTHVERLLSNVARLADGVCWAESDRLALYQVRRVAGAAVWVWVVGGPFPVTLSPDTKPADLGARDAGFLVYSTDFNRPFTWNGAGWQDGPGAESRHQVVFFASVPSPFPGWQLCDGSTVNRTTSAGGMTSLTVPDLITARRVLRANSAAGGVGGAATTHTHAVSVLDTVSRTVAGVGNNTVGAQTVASGAPSGVSGDDALPPYYDALPYYRL